MRSSGNSFSRPRFRPRLELLEDRCTPATLPSGFAESIVGTGLISPTAMELAPDGRIWVLEQSGNVEVFHAGSAASWRALTLPAAAVDSAGERGLLGITFAPDYDITSPASDFVYLYYTSTTAPNAHNRISRFTVDNSNPNQPRLGSERVIFELDPLSGARNHNGGAIHFGPDGKLYAAVGDNALGSNAQSLGTLHGKMLRINADGTVPTDNPFYAATTGKNRAIWALGLRNPFTFSFQVGTGRMFINDVGQNSWEEIDEGVAGANYGWPTTEGDFNQASFPNFRRPFFAYSHGSGTFQGYAITGGAFYDPTIPGTDRFPDVYSGDYFFADFVNDWITVLDPGTKSFSRFASNTGGPVDLKVAPEGGLLYLARNEGRVYRIRYTADDAPNITRQPPNRTVSEGRSATFDVQATGSSPLIYQWQRAETGTNSWEDIPGATTASYAISNAQFSDGGDQFRVVITNAFGTVTSHGGVLTVTANQAPSATISVSSGLTNGKFSAGRAIGFAATATDPEEGSLGASSFAWRIDYITSIASGSPVVRPFVPTFSGLTGRSFTPATQGPYTLTDVAYRIVLTVTDSNGESTTVTRDLAPNTTVLTISSNLGGTPITVDGQPVSTPHSFASVVGFLRPIETAATLGRGGAVFDFVAWSDGKPRAHIVQTPIASTTYLATYRAAPQAFRARVNFQDASSVGFGGYVVDTGLPFANRGNGFAYGWNVNNAVNTRNRNSPRSPDERFDTLALMQRSPNVNARWEIAVSNGTYTVRLMVGDPIAIDSFYRIAVEGVLAIQATPRWGERWFQKTVNVVVRDGRLTLSNVAGSINNKVSFVEIATASARPAASLQDGGPEHLVSIDAENYDNQFGRAGKNWSPYPVAGYSGFGALWTTPNTGDNVDVDYMMNSPRLDYRIHFVEGGLHYVWIRGAGASDVDDSFHVGLDGQPVATADRVSGFVDTYGWSRDTMDLEAATINIPAPGIYTLNLWMREDGGVVDRIVLTTNAAYTPTGAGPAASPRY